MSLKSLTAAILGVLVLCRLSWAETNFEFFFKTEDNYRAVKVVEVRAINRFVIYNSDNQKEIIRMIGLKPVEAPRQRRVETERDQYGFRLESEVEHDRPWEETAFESVQEMLMDQTVRLEFDSTKKDDDNYTLAYVFMEKAGQERFINQEILRQGWSDLQVRPPNTKYRKELQAAYREARREKRGLQGQ